MAILTKFNMLQVIIKMMVRKQILSQKVLQLSRLSSLNTLICIRKNKREIIENFQQLLEEVKTSLQKYEELESCQKNVDKIASILKEIDLSDFNDTEKLSKIERRLKKAKQIFDEFYTQKISDLMSLNRQIEKSNSETLDQIITFVKEVAVNEAKTTSKAIISNISKGSENSYQEIVSALDQIKAKEKDFSSNFMSSTIKLFNDLEDYLSELENMTAEVQKLDKAKINKEKETLLNKISSCDDINQNLQKQITELQRHTQKLEEKCYT